ncbi:MAG: TRAP transporter small permease [Spirochaetaceae bacterium]|nr:TRAP transporter small permease [Spirochaetaceae bacterium]
MAAKYIDGRRMMKALKLLDSTVRQVLRVLCVVLFSALGLLLLANVFLRLAGDFTRFLNAKGLSGAAAFITKALPRTSFHWLDEIVELCFSALIFYGAAALWAIKGHFSAGDWLSKRLPGRTSRAVYKMLISLVCAFFFAVLFFFGCRLVARTSELSTVFQIPKKVMYSCIPISAFIMLCYSAADIAADVLRLIGEKRAH